MTSIEVIIVCINAFFIVLALVWAISITVHYTNERGKNSGSKPSIYSTDKKTTIVADPLWPQIVSIGETSSTTSATRRLSASSVLHVPTQPPEWQQQIGEMTASEAPAPLPASLRTLLFFSDGNADLNAPYVARRIDKHTTRIVILHVAKQFLSAVDVSSVSYQVIRRTYLSLPSSDDNTVFTSLLATDSEKTRIFTMDADTHFSLCVFPTFVAVATFDNFDRMDD